MVVEDKGLGLWIMCPPSITVAPGQGSCVPVGMKLAYIGVYAEGSGHPLCGQDLPH